MRMRAVWRRRWRVIAAASLLLLTGGLVAGWFLFQHIPSWYHPVTLAPVDHQRIIGDLTHAQDMITESLAHEDTSFEHRFTEEQINAWLAVREAIWPLAREWLPASVSDPAVAIRPDGLRLGITYHQGRLKTVVSAKLEARADPDGIYVRLVELATGSLAVPDSWVDEQLAKLDQRGWPAGQRAKRQHGSARLPSLARLTEGVVFPNEWTWEFSNDRPFRIVGLEFEEGALVVTFEPLEW